MSDVALSVVIPVRNEAALLRPAVDQLFAGLRSLRVPFEVILVENGSADGTGPLARALAGERPELRVQTLPVANYGRALRTGMEAARGDVIVNFDLDYWDVPFLQDSLDLTKRRFDIVIGSKNLLLSSDRRGPLRRLVSRCFRLLLRFVFQLRVSDTHGIKVWRRSPALENLMRTVRFDHHLFDTELIIRSQRAGLRIVELPVEVSETRKPPWGILRRIPRALLDIVRLRLLLWGESTAGRG
jgi:glycosyltransferase involved in cell wall biosynthesis